MQFQKISIPTTRKVIGNSKGEGASKAKIFQKKALKKKNTGIFRGVGPVETEKTLCGRGTDIFWNNTLLSAVFRF